jgi:hypothetical protein
MEDVEALAAEPMVGSGVGGDGRGLLSGASLLSRPARQGRNSFGAGGRVAVHTLEIDATIEAIAIDAAAAVVFAGDSLGQIHGFDICR